MATSGEQGLGGLELGRLGLIGTGFVGGELLKQVKFARAYDSKTIGQIDGERFDTLICAGAPATMWAANANPEADAANLATLTAALAKARFERLILISTIAVFDSASSGYTESLAHYEQAQAYGRHRRELEVHAQERYRTTVVRLPALFGRGLKKNFIFDMLNPLPSFIKPSKFSEVCNVLPADARTQTESLFSWDASLSMYRLDRDRLATSPGRRDLEREFERIGFTSTAFTNSDSSYQFYGLSNLWRDLTICLTKDLDLVNISSEPWQAGDLHLALLGRPFVNHDPAVVRQDVRTQHAAAFGRSGQYLYSRSEVLAELKHLFGEGRCTCA